VDNNAPGTPTNPPTVHPTPIPTGSPTKVPIPVPTMAPMAPTIGLELVDRGECENSATFRHNNDKSNKDCATWVIAANPSFNCRRKAPGTGYIVKFFCPGLCNEKCKIASQL
jgi:hypothetical protein